MKIPVNYKNSTQAEKYIKPEAIEAELKTLIPGAVVTRGNFSTVAPGYVHDFEWNQLDQLHRNYVHNAYHDAMRVVTGKDFALSVTRWKNWPVFIQVADVRLSSTLHYQFFSLFGILHCHQVSTFTQMQDQVKVEVNWYTASHWLLKPLHYIFNGMLDKLQAKQAQEDLQIRQRRFELRQKGFNFKTDWPDYINSNVLTDQVLVPTFSTITLDSSSLSEGEITMRTIAQLEFFFLKEGARIQIWPGVCSHEGARMSKPENCDSVLSCPWHGRKFPKVELKENVPWKFLDLQFLRREQLIQVTSMARDEVVPRNENSVQI